MQQGSFSLLGLLVLEGLVRFFRDNCQDVKFFYQPACWGKALPSVLLMSAGLIKLVREMLAGSMTQHCLNWRQWWIPQKCLEKQSQGNTEDFGKLCVGCLRRNLYAYLLIFASKGQMWILLRSLSRRTVSVSKIRAECEVSLCLRTRQSLHFGLSSSQCWEKPLLLWSLLELTPKVQTPSCC